MGLEVLLVAFTALVGGIAIWLVWRSTVTGLPKKDVSKRGTSCTDGRRVVPEDRDSAPLLSTRTTSVAGNCKNEGNSCVELSDKLSVHKSCPDQHPDTGSETEALLTSDCFLNDGVSTEQFESDIQKVGDAQAVSEKAVAEGTATGKVASAEGWAEKASAEKMVLSDKIFAKVASTELGTNNVVSEDLGSMNVVSEELGSENVVSEELIAEKVASEETLLERTVSESAVSAEPVEKKEQCASGAGNTNTHGGASKMHQQSLKVPGYVKESMSECSNAQGEEAVAGTSRADARMAASVESQQPSQNSQTAELKKKLCWVKARALERLGVRGVEFALKQTGAAVEKRKRRRQRFSVAPALKSRKDKSDFSGREESEWQSEEDTSTEDEDHGCYDADASILGAYASRMIENPEEARAEAEQLKTKGNVCFKEKQIDEALQHYTEAIVVAPTVELLSVLLSNRAACFTIQKEYRNAVEECTDGLSLDPTFAKLYLRRFRAYEAQEKWHDALTDINKALELDPSLRSTYRDIRQRVEKLSQEEFERQKEEMLDKLKTFGNWALGKVGLSMDNFKLEQNPETGSYNISYQQNAPA